MLEKAWSAAILPEEVEELLIKEHQDNEAAKQRYSASMLESSSNLDISGGNFVASAGDYVHHEHKNTFIIMPAQAKAEWNPSKSDPSSYIKSLEKRVMDSEELLSLITSFQAPCMSDALKPKALSPPFDLLQLKSDYGATYLQKPLLKNQPEKLTTFKESYAPDTSSPTNFLDVFKTGWEPYVHPEGTEYYSTNPSHPSHWVNEDDNCCTFPVLTCSHDGFSSFEESFCDSSVDENLSPQSLGSDDEDKWKAWQDSWNAWHAYWTAVYVSWTSWASSWTQWFWTPPTLVNWRPLW